MNEGMKEILAPWLKPVEIGWQLIILNDELFSF